MNHTHPDFKPQNLGYYVSVNRERGLVGPVYIVRLHGSLNSYFAQHASRDSALKDAKHQAHKNGLFCHDYTGPKVAYC